MADLSITSANVVPSDNASIISKKRVAAGVSITAGDVVALDTDGDLVLADASAEATNTPVGIAAVAAEAGQPCAYIEKDSDLALGATVANGAALYLSGAAGGGITITLADLSGHTPVSFGMGKASNKVSVDFIALHKSDATA